MKNFCIVLSALNFKLPFSPLENVRIMFVERIVTKYKCYLFYTFRAVQYLPEASSPKVGIQVLLLSNM